MKTKSLLKSLMDLLFRSFFARKYCASTSLLTVSENLLKYLALWQMTEMRLFEYFPTTVYSETAKYEASSSHFLQKSWRKKMTLDFILCQSRKLYEESWNEECFFEGFPNDEFSATAKKGVPRVGLGFALRICTNPPMNSEFEMKQGQIFLPTSKLWKNTCWLIHVIDRLRPFLSLKWSPVRFNNFFAQWPFKIG